MKSHNSCFGYCGNDGISKFATQLNTVNHFTIQHEVCLNIERCFSGKQTGSLFGFFFTAPNQQTCGLKKSKNANKNEPSQ